MPLIVKRFLGNNLDILWGSVAVVAHIPPQSDEERFDKEIAGLGLFETRRAESGLVG